MLHAMSSANHPAEYDTLTGRFVYTPAQVAKAAADASRQRAATVARNAAAEGLTVAEYEDVDRLFAPFA